MLLNCGVGEDSWEALGLQAGQTSNPKGNQFWIFIGRTDAESEALILWPPDAKNWLMWKDPDSGKDWRQKGTTEDKMVGWHHWLYGHEFEQAPGVGDGQGSLAYCSPWGCKESDTNERLNWTDITWTRLRCWVFTGNWSKNKYLNMTYHRWNSKNSPYIFLIYHGHFHHHSSGSII